MTSPQPRLHALTPDRSEVFRILAALADAGEPFSLTLKTADVLLTLEVRPLSAVGFVPTRLQQDILAGLAGKSLRTDALAHKCDVDRAQIFRKGGLPELRERGLVAHHPSIGFYRPDAPPSALKAITGEEHP